MSDRFDSRERSTIEQIIADIKLKDIDRKLKLAQRDREVQSRSLAPWALVASGATAAAAFMAAGAVLLKLAGG